MADTEKQRWVRTVFEQFGDLCDALPASDCEIWEDTPKDPPDVAVGGNALGIEFVRFLRGLGSDGSSAKAIENFYEQAVARAKQRFEERNSVSLWISFTWKDYRPEKTLMPQVVDAIVETIEDLLPLLSADPLSLSWYEVSNPILRSYLASIWILNVETTNSYWGNIQAAHFDDNMIKMLVEKIIRGKEADLPRYQHRFGEVWLVIVAEGSGMSSILGLDEPLNPGCLTSEFDRVYLLDAGKNQLMLLTENKS